MNIIEQIEQEQLSQLTAKNPVPEFSPGDTIKVWVKVIEGSREREQAFEGICIARKNAGINSSFTVRKISYGEGVERLFPVYSPKIKIEVVRRGKVRRAKLYYLRELRGKKARIVEKSEYGKAMAAAEAEMAPAAEEVKEPAAEKGEAPAAPPEKSEKAKTKPAKSETKPKKE